MKYKLKNLHEQTLVITGASSGIGLVTARKAVGRGARVVLASRNEEALKQIVDDMQAQGHEAIYVVADVSKHEDVQRIAEAAIERFGGFDTWVNNAAVSMYGNIEHVQLEDHRRLFEIDYWGVVHGCMVALAHLRERGGALINIGSVLADRAIPVQGPYCASKHAVKGFTDALRMELEQDGAPVSVTLIKPSAIDTPYMDHAKNYLSVAPKNPPPIYAPDLVANAVLYAAEHGRRDIIVGGGGKVISLVGTTAPRTSDIVMEYTMPYLQRTSEPAGDPAANNLFKPGRDGKERSHLDQFVLERSLYTSAILHPIASTLIAVGLGAAAAAAMGVHRR